MSNYIHPTTIIDPEAVIGENNHFGPFCVVHKGVVIGDNNRFESHCSVGSTAEHRDFFTKYGLVIIGNFNLFREYVTINSSTTGITQVGNNCVALRHSHISHDTIIEDNVNISCDVLIGGESIIMQGANLGLGAVLHQRSLVGSYSMVGMNSTVTKSVHVVPGNIYAGSPAKMISQNKIGLERGGVTDPRLLDEITRYLDIRKTGVYTKWID